MLTDPNSEPATSTAPSSGAPQRTLQQIVQQACGARAEDVELVFQSPTKVLVRLWVPNRQEADR
jgi:hypothetical protein